MVDRIRLILQAKQLSPTQFADTIGAARPVVSHILSGRNKPSLEVVQKILAAFPELSMAWLLNGVGPMQALAATSTASPVAAGPPAPASGSGYAEVDKASPSSKSRRAPASPPRVAAYEPALPAPAPTEPDRTPLFSGSAELTTGFAPSSPAAAPIPGRQELYHPPIAPPIPAPVAAPPAAADVPATPAPATSPSPTAAALLAAPEKAIRRIVIFYKDGSFADYQPE